MIKRHRRSLLFLFVLLGAGYFSAFSQLDISPFFKSYLTIVPVQVLALGYFLYLRWSNRSIA
ncbi:MAG TPA: hypothetical protein V6C57_27140 [Coleofasciculaceae cyanobacterium]